MLFDSTLLHLVLLVCMPVSLSMRLSHYRPTMEAGVIDITNLHHRVQLNTNGNNVIVLNTWYTCNLALQEYGCHTTTRAPRMLTAANVPSVMECTTSPWPISWLCVQHPGERQTPITNGCYKEQPPRVENMSHEIMLGLVFPIPCTCSL